MRSMPETRTYESSDDDPFGKAVREAIGGDVRPNRPGEAKDAAGGGERAASPEKARPTTRSTLPSSTLGSFTFARPQKPAPGASGENEGGSHD